MEWGFEALICTELQRRVTLLSMQVFAVVYCFKLSARKLSALLSIKMISVFIIIIIIINRAHKVKWGFDLHRVDLFENRVAKLEMQTSNSF